MIHLLLSIVHHENEQEKIKKNCLEKKLGGGEGAEEEQ